MSPIESNGPKPKAYNDHNVYILGAGFAVEAGLPTVKGFMNRTRDAAAWLHTQTGRQQEIAAIEKVLDFRLRAAAAAYRVPLDVEDVEELFSLASAREGEGLVEDMSLAIAATLDFARHDFQEREAKRPKEFRFYQVGVLDPSNWAQPSNWGPPLSNIESEVKEGRIKGQWHTCPLYEFYAGIIGGYFNLPSVDRRDTVITFNYDLTIESALYDLGVPFSYGLSGKSVNFGPGTSGAIFSEEYAEASALRVLKLHGSVNWAFPGGVGQKLTFYRNYDEVRQKKLAPVIVPPTWRKQFGGQLSDVWDEAVKALRKATRIIVLGYSIPSTDVHFKYLLAAGLQDNISLRKVLFVNPGLAQPDVGDRLRAQLFSVLSEQHLKRGLIELAPEKTGAFFHGSKDTTTPPYRESIGRPLPALYTAGTPYMTFPPFF